MNELKTDVIISYFHIVISFLLRYSTVIIDDKEYIMTIGKTKIFIVIPLILIMTAIAGVLYLHKYYPGIASGIPLYWEKSIRLFENYDKQHPPKKGEIVFVGSSSIKFWQSLSRDMAPLITIRRGFGGCRISDVVFYTDRIVTPYEPRAVVLFAGTNDLMGSIWDKSPEQILHHYKKFVSKVHKKLPLTSIYYLSITPTRARLRYWPTANRANTLIKEYCAAHKRLYFIDTTDAIMGNDGLPRDDLFIADDLHLNEKGYALWTSLIKPHLMQLEVTK